MKRFLLIFTAFLMLISVTGCTVITYDVSGAKEVISMTRLEGDYETVGHFKWSTRGVFLISLITVMNPDLEKQLDKELTRKDGNREKPSFSTPARFWSPAAVTGATPFLPPSFMTPVPHLPPGL